MGQGSYKQTWQWSRRLDPPPPSPYVGVAGKVRSDRRADRYMLRKIITKHYKGLFGPSTNSSTLLDESKTDHIPQF